MPSDAATATAPQAPGKPRLAWLRSQGLGVICGQLTVLLLGIGSFVIANSRDGASKNLGMEDLHPFFDEPHVAHTWFYLLIPVVTLYAVNTLLGTWDDVFKKWRAGLRSPFDYGAAFFHVAFLLALFAHLVGGWYAKERDPIVLGTAWLDVGDGREARLESLEIDAYPGGMPSDVRAEVQVRTGSNSPIETEIVGFNAPLSRGFGTDLALLVRWGVMSQIANLVIDGEPCALTEGTTCKAGDSTVSLLGFGPAGTREGAMLEVTTPVGQRDRWMLTPGRETTLADGAHLRLDTIGTRPALLLRRRHAPGNPWALLSAVFMLGGIVFLGPRWWR